MLDTNIDSGSMNERSQDEENAEMAAMQKEAEKMGLDPAELTGEISGDLTQRPSDPFNTDKTTGFGQPGDDTASEPQDEDKAEDTPKTDPEPESEEEEGEEDGDEEEEGSEQGQGKGQPSPETDSKFITKGQFGKFTRELKTQFKELASAIQTLANARGKAETKQAADEVKEQVDEIEEYAKKFKDENGNPLNAEGLRELTDIIKRSVLKDIPLDKIKQMETLEPVVTQMSANMQQEEILTVFNSEWDTQGLPEINKLYPNASPEQKEKAKQKMLELATSEQYGFVEGKHDAYPLSYILFKEAQSFNDLLFSPKKKTAEGSHLGGETDLGDISEEQLLGTNYEDMTPAKAAALGEKINHTDDSY